MARESDPILVTIQVSAGPKSSPTAIEILNKHDAVNVLALKKEEESLAAETRLVFGTAELDVDSYTPKGGNRFQEWKDGGSPYSSLVNPATQRKSDALARKRRGYIKAAMQHAWTGYQTHAFGADELGPVSGKPNSHWGGIGTTLVDALDTLWLMDMKDEFYEARDWVRDKLDHDKDKNASLFETTIRSLGGLLSAYEWSEDRAFLEKAQDLGDRLIKAFDVPGANGIPSGSINLSTGISSTPSWQHGNIFLAEIGTLPVEFRQLSKQTGNSTYANKAERVFRKLKDIEPSNGLFPYSLRLKTGNLEFANKAISFSAFGDSFYEYALKIWLQGGRKEPMYRSMYDRSIDGMHAKQLQVSASGLTYIHFGMEVTRMDHLTCFMGGLLVLGAWSDPDGITSERAQRDLKTGKSLAYTCYQMYASTPTGLSPESVHIVGTGIRAREKYYTLRPETVETMYILSSITGDPVYREWGWEIFQSIEKYCKTDIAYGRLDDVMDTDKSPADSMESFFLAETLKYLYLLMDPDSDIDLENYVFNTEAHPLKIWK